MTCFPSTIVSHEIRQIVTRDEWCQTCIDRKVPGWGVISRNSHQREEREYSTLLRAWLNELTATVHAPHPPSAQPSFVPVRPMLRRYSSNVHSGSGRSRWILEPLTQNVIVSIHPAVRTRRFSASLSSVPGFARIEGAMALEAERGNGERLRRVCFVQSSVPRGGVSVALLCPREPMLFASADVPFRAPRATTVLSTPDFGCHQLPERAERLTRSASHAISVN